MKLNPSESGTSRQTPLLHGLSLHVCCIRGFVVGTTVDVDITTDDVCDGAIDELCGIDVVLGEVGITVVVRCEIGGVLLDDTTIVVCWETTEVVGVTLDVVAFGVLVGNFVA